MVAVLALLALDPAFAGAKASSFEKNSKDSTKYAAGSAVDGKAETCWSVPPESPNRGEWISVEVNAGDVEKIGIVAGWDRDEKTFKDYPRVKQLRVDVFVKDETESDKQVGSETIDVADVRGMQIIPLKSKVTIPGGPFPGWVKLSVVDIYPGTDFPNLHVSEVAVFKSEMDATPKVEGLDDAALTAVTDGSPKTVWTAAPGATFTVQPGDWALSSIGLQGVKGKAMAKTVKVKVGERPEQTFTLTEKPDLQWLPLAPVSGVNGSSTDSVQVTLLDAHGADITLQELKFKATYFGMF